MKEEAYYPAFCLNSQQICLVTEAYLYDVPEKVPPGMLLHLRFCPQCLAQVITLYNVCYCEDDAGSTRHQFFGQLPRRLPKIVLFPAVRGASGENEYFEYGLN